MKLKDTLKDLLTRNDMSQTDLSRVTDIPVSTINGWLNGVDPKNITQLKVIADYYNVSLDFLCFGEMQQEIASKRLNDDINIGNFEVILRRRKP